MSDILHLICNFKYTFKLNSLFLGSWLKVSQNIVLSSIYLLKFWLAKKSKNKFKNQAALLNVYLRNSCLTKKIFLDFLLFENKNLK